MTTDSAPERTGIRAFYGRWAGVYDVLARLPVVRSWRSRAADALALGAADTAVEVGCGTGANLRYLRHRVGPDGRVVGVDVTRRVLEIARDRGDGTVVQGDARRPPIAGPVDGLLAAFLVGMLSDPRDAVAEWCDRVEPGGRVVLLHFVRSERRFTAPLDLAYRALLRLSSPGRSGRSDDGAASEEVVGDGVRDVPEYDPVAVHDARVRAAHGALAERATAYRELSLAAGYVRVAIGELPE